MFHRSINLKRFSRLRLQRENYWIPNIVSLYVWSKQHHKNHLLNKGRCICSQKRLNTLLHQGGPLLHEGRNFIKEAWQLRLKLVNHQPPNPPKGHCKGYAASAAHAHHPNYTIHFPLSSSQYWFCSGLNSVSRTQSMPPEGIATASPVSPASYSELLQVRSFKSEGFAGETHFIEEPTRLVPARAPLNIVLGFFQQATPSAVEFVRNRRPSWCAFGLLHHHNFSIENIYRLSST